MGEIAAGARCRYESRWKGSHRPCTAAQPGNEKREKDTMKNVFAFVSFAAVAVMLTETANAARFKGVVVSKDAKRHALVTASPGAVRTVRAPSRFSRFRVG